MRFINRIDAGKKLAERLAAYRGADVVVYALPRGGVVVGWEVAKALNAPLDLIVCRKIGHPSNPEYAICAIAEDGHVLCNEEERARCDEAWFSDAARREQEEATRRRKLYGSGQPAVSCADKTAIVVDDGVATGMTLLLAIRELKEHQKPKHIIAAVPVSPQDTAKKIEQEANKLIALEVPTIFMGAVGAYYDEFAQVSDEEVIAIMRECARGVPA